MRLSETIRRQMAEVSPYRGGVQSLVAEANGLTVRCELTAADGLGCALSKLELESDSTKDLPFDWLSKLADRLCNRITYLLEPLQTIEADKRTGSVLVRSKKPRKTDGNLSYYEMVADNHHHAMLERYRYDVANRGRTAVPMVLTQDQLEMLVDDLAETMAEINEQSQQSRY